MANTDNKNNKKFSLRKLIYNDKYLIVFSLLSPDAGAESN